MTDPEKEQAPKAKNPRPWVRPVVFAAAVLVLAGALGFGAGYLTRGGDEGQDLSERQAFEHYLRAALGGDPEALHEVGRCYYYGIGVGEDKALAEIWLDHADGEEMEDGFSEDDED